MISHHCKSIHWADLNTSRTRHRRTIGYRCLSLSSFSFSPLHFSSIFLSPPLSSSPPLAAATLSRGIPSHAKSYSAHGLRLLQAVLLTAARGGLLLLLRSYQSEQMVAAMAADGLDGLKLGKTVDGKLVPAPS